MFGHWYNSSLRRYIVLMGDLFSHVQVARTREDTGIKFIKVPITYASKEKFMSQLGKITAIQSTQDKAKVETILPRMNLHMVDLQYNAQYKTALQNRSAARYQDGDPRKSVSQFSPTPVKMIFELGIYTRHQDDMYQIIEQILPYFQPHFNTTITELYTNDIKFERDIRIVFQSAAMDEQFEGDNITRRRLEWSIMFEVNGWIYPPVADISGEIRTIYIDFFANTKELTPEGIFESVDSEVVPRHIEAAEWDGSYEQTYSKDTPIPVPPQEPGPRTNK
ncbi:tail sheath stabilizer and completion protein [Kosakonia phage Kc304]|uniref:Tail sheath stabilizer and completion protein n=2 Tax=Winklervirus chi14 TaxID=2560752 RepID=A0A1Z1LYF9_9CAUD|nr:tail sheath stabilizer [Serratia phage CHI14]ARW57591.1 tail sheath stabilizer and completion protein [Serratia phage CHI14]ARW57866.1 tail sheath stabilizer and completion protein [Serratia phage CBH8]QYN80614.1 tail sheath stabilizer and completion protein [Kosakonia phage Kc304]UJJ22160.1 tail sheath stabilizer and completion protein [Erwinia phage Virsaitis27]